MSSAKTVPPLVRTTSNELHHETHLFGQINGSSFDLRGGGKGNPYEGRLNAFLTSSSGPVDFPMHLLSVIVIMGYPTFSNYQKGGYDLFKISDGYSYERHLKFEDGGVMNSRHVITRTPSGLRGEFEVINATLQPPTLVDIEPTVETFMPAGPGKVESFFRVRWLTNNGGRYSADVHSTYMLRHNLELPFTHFRLVQFDCNHTQERLQQNETLIVLHDFARLSV